MQFMRFLHFKYFIFYMGNNFYNLSICRKISVACEIYLTVFFKMFIFFHRHEVYYISSDCCPRSHVTSMTFVCCAGPGCGIAAMYPEFNVAVIIQRVGHVHMVAVCHGAALWAREPLCYKYSITNI